MHFKTKCRNFALQNYYTVSTMSILTTKSRLLLVTLATLFISTMSVVADTYEEDFSSVTGTSNYNGTVTALPEGWGYIGDLSAFSFETEKYKSQKVAISITTNTENYLVTPKVQGNVHFWVRNYTKSYQASINVYACTEENGVFTLGDIITSKTLSKSSSTPSWEKISFNVANASRLAILLSKGCLDDFYAYELITDDSGNPDNPPVVIEKKELTMLSFERTCDYELTANEENKFTATFNVGVKNTGDTKLEADEVSVSITNADGTVVYTTATATAALEVDDSTTIPVTVTADAGDGGYLSFYAKENISNTYCKNNYGNNAYVNVHITAFKPAFAINGPDGTKLWADDTIDFGTVNTTATKTITIKNDGTAPLAVSSISVPDGFKVEESAFSVEAGSQKVITLTLTPTEGHYGKKQGEATITHALGTFSFKLQGTTVDPSVYFVNFENGALPESWTVGQNWTVTTQSGNHYAQQSSNVEATAIITQKLVVSAGESMSIQAKRAYSYTEATLTVSYSTNKAEWTKIEDFALTSAFTDYTLSGIPAGTVYLMFEGQYVAIDNLIGFHESTDAPKLGVFDAEGKAISNNAVLDFGLQTADAATTFTVKNVGTGSLYVQLNATEGFTLDKSEVTLAAGAQETVTLTMSAEPYGEKSGTLSILSEVEELSIVLQGTTRDASLLYVDFQDKQWPKGWTADDKWSITNESYSSPEYYAEHSDYTGAAGSLVTAKLLFLEGMPLSFDARRANETYESSLKVYYSTDRLQWTVAADLTAELSNEFATQQVTIPAGENYVMFEAANVCLDNITGAKLTSDDHMVELSAQFASEATVNWEYQAKATVKNIWADSEEVTLRFVFGGKELKKETFTLGYGESQTLTTGFTPHVLPDEPAEAYFEMTYAGKTVKSEVKNVVIKAESDETNAIILTGIITDDSEEPKPLEGVSITLTSQTEEAIYVAETDANGQFTVKVWRGNLFYTLTAVKDGYEAEPKTLIFVGNKDDFALTMKNLNPDTPDIPDGVKGVNANSQQQPVYNMQGQRVRLLGKGLYIKNGKKHIIKK